MIDTPTEIHPAAELLPLMSEGELQALADDIRENGLRDPIKLVGEGADARVLDGRNRLAACTLAGVEPRFETLNGADPLAAVISLNVKRRKMLTIGQRAVAAAESWPLVGGRPNTKGGRPKKKPPGEPEVWTYERMAARWEVGDDALRNATALVERDPAAAAEVKSGSVSLEAAYDALLKRERDAKSQEASLEGLRLRHPDLAEMVAVESLALSEALAAGRTRDDALAEERKTRTGVLSTLVSARAPVEHATAYIESYDRTYDPAEAVTVESLREAAAFAAALAEQWKE